MKKYDLHVLPERVLEGSLIRHHESISRMCCLSVHQKYGGKELGYMTFYRV